MEHLTNIDLEFLIQLEGGSLLEGYVPPVAKSGVTVACGIDLGQHFPEDFREAGVNEELIRKCKPYFQVKREEAEALLEECPLFLTREEASHLESCIMNDYAKKLKLAYGRYAKQCPTVIQAFEDLPKEAATVTFSLAWNCGTQLFKSAPRSWYFITNNLWELLQRELNNFGYKIKGLSNRRMKEAVYLTTLTGVNSFEPVPKDYKFTKKVENIEKHLRFQNNRYTNIQAWLKKIKIYKENAIKRKVYGKLP